MATETVFWMIDNTTDQVIGTSRNREVADEIVALTEVIRHHHCHVFPVEMIVSAPTHGAMYERT